MLSPSHTHSASPLRRDTTETCWMFLMFSVLFHFCSIWSGFFWFSHAQLDVLTKLCYHALRGFCTTIAFARIPSIECFDEECEGSREEEHNSFKNKPWLSKHDCSLRCIMLTSGAAYWDWLCLESLCVASVCLECAAEDGGGSKCENGI